MTTDLSGHKAITKEDIIILNDRIKLLENEIIVAQHNGDDKKVLRLSEELSEIKDFLLKKEREEESEQPEQTVEFNENTMKPSLKYKIKIFYIEHEEIIKIVAVIIFIAIMAIGFSKLPKTKVETKSTEKTPTEIMQELYSQKAVLVTEKSIQTAKIKRLQEQQTLTQSGITSIDKQIKTLIIELEK